MRRWGILALFLTACGTDGGVLVEVSQGPGVEAPVDTLQLFVGTPDEQLGGGFAGVALPGDIVALDPTLDERHHTVELVAGAGMGPETPVRIAVVGKVQRDVVALGILDVPGIPTDVVLKYPLELQPIDDVLMTDSGCLVLPDGTVVAAENDRDCDGVKADLDCNDLDAQVHPGAYDACSGSSFDVDDDCNGVKDDGDLDGDGVNCQSDCADDDEARTPGKIEDCDGGVDNDCDFAIDEGIPEICDDGLDNDCDPLTPDISIEEICGDGYDNDCDTFVDEGREGGNDIDQDGYICAEDCDDDNGEVHPEAQEICNQNDDDCDLATDEEANDDGDPAPCLFDCDDLNNHRYPGNPEVCDVFDNDCVPTTHAAARPCFDYTVDPCQFGTQACNETLGSYVDSCQPNATSGPVPDAVCAEFAPCVDDPRGLACAGNPNHNCTQAVDSGGDVCAGATRPLAAPGNANACTWTILGGATQQGWTVGLLAQGSVTPQPMVTTCPAQFTVLAVPAGLQPMTFLVVSFADGLYDHTEVFTILPEPGNICPIPSLQCTSTSGT